MAAKSQHVVPRGGKWAVRKAGAGRVTRHFNTQKEAIEAARGIARNGGGEVFIHGRDGRIRQRNSYGNDRFHRAARAARRPTTTLAEARS